MNRRHLGARARRVFTRRRIPRSRSSSSTYVGETVRGPFRQAVVYLLRARSGRVLLLRELVDTAALNELLSGRYLSASITRRCQRHRGCLVH